MKSLESKYGSSSLVKTQTEGVGFRFAENFHRSKKLYLTQTSMAKRDPTLSKSILKSLYFIRTESLTSAHTL